MSNLKTTGIVDAMGTAFSNKTEPVIFGSAEKAHNSTFARLFETIRYGQILVMLQRGEKGNPELQWSIKPEGFDVCTVSFTYPDTDASWDSAQNLLESFNLDDALGIAEEIAEQLQKMGD